MQDVDFVNGLIDFIKNSPTPFHAVEVMAQILERHGFKQLDETEQWDVNGGKPGERFYVTRNDSSIEPDADRKWYVHGGRTHRQSLFKSKTQSRDYQ